MHLILGFAQSGIAPQDGDGRDVAPIDGIGLAEGFPGRAALEESESTLWAFLSLVVVWILQILQASLSCPATMACSRAAPDS